MPFKVLGDTPPVTRIPFFRLFFHASVYPVVPSASPKEENIPGFAINLNIK